MKDDKSIVLVLCNKKFWLCELLLLEDSVFIKILYNLWAHFFNYLQKFSLEFSFLPTEIIVDISFEESEKLKL